MDERTNFLREITEAFGPPGLEDDVARLLEARTRSFCEVERDNLGSFIARKRGGAEKPTVMVAGHMDEVAFMVTDVEAGGYVRIRPLGGWWPHVLLGQRLKVRTRKGDFLAVVGSKPPHELKTEERTKVLEFDDIFLDLGVADGFDVVEETGVRRGDFAVPHAPFESLANGNLHVVKAWDNRVGCALAVDLLRELREVGHPNTVYGVATVQEEIGLRGAATSVEMVQPDIAFAVDVGIARDTPRLPGAREGARAPRRRRFDPAPRGECRLSPATHALRDGCGGGGGDRAPQHDDQGGQHRRGALPDQPAGHSQHGHLRPLALHPQPQQHRRPAGLRRGPASARGGDETPRREDGRPHPRLSRKCGSAAAPWWS
ncbi:MAG: M42 family metallopeptidase [Planctomycetes bacterium]|nr:M42 family metallopeptidase [Planctomycetota bacterium]